MPTLRKSELSFRKYLFSYPWSIHFLTQGLFIGQLGPMDFSNVGFLNFITKGKIWDFKNIKKFTDLI